MPVYEYLCNKCGKTFSEILTIAQMEKQKMKCPKCKSGDVKRIVSHIHTITKKKS